MACDHGEVRATFCLRLVWSFNSHRHCRVCSSAVRHRKVLVSPWRVPTLMGSSTQILRKIMGGIPPIIQVQTLTSASEQSESLASLLLPVSPRPRSTEVHTSRSGALLRSLPHGNSGRLAGHDKNRDVCATGSMPLDRQDFQALMCHSRLKAVTVETQQVGRFADGAHQR